MKLKKRNAKPLMVAKFTAEATRRGGAVTANQRRFFSVAISSGKEMEPVGVMAGAKA